MCALHPSTPPSLSPSPPPPPPHPSSSSEQQEESGSREERLEKQEAPAQCQALGSASPASAAAAVCGGDSVLLTGQRKPGSSTLSLLSPSTSLCSTPLAGQTEEDVAISNSGTPPSPKPPTSPPITPSPHLLSPLNILSPISSSGADILPCVLVSMWREHTRK